ncbi:hypothetical protein GQX74_004892 [Glossina fuscipes]|nr:hypothetical protein GQX74_004892 [Glossina fuscipes]
MDRHTEAVEKPAIHNMKTISLRQKLIPLWQSPMNQNRGGTLIQKLFPDNSNTSRKIRQFQNTVKKDKFTQRNEISKFGNSTAFWHFIEEHDQMTHNGPPWDYDNNLIYLNLLKN